MSEHTRYDLMTPCSDHGCILKRRGTGGMGTNGGCEHLKMRGPLLNGLLRAMGKTILELQEQLDNNTPKTAFVSGGLLQEQQDSLLRAERDEARAQRDQLLARLKDVMPWVGLLPVNPTHVYEMTLIKDLARDSVVEITSDIKRREKK